MAPTDAANSLHGNRPRPSTARNIVPAIPLPYIQKRKQHASAARQIEEPQVLASSGEVPSTSSPALEDNTPSVTNGSPSCVIANPEVVEESSVDSSIKLAVVQDMTPPADVVREVTVAKIVHETTTPAPQAALADDAQQIQTVVSTDQHSSESRSPYTIPPSFGPAAHGYSHSNMVEGVQLPRRPSFDAQHPSHNPHASAGSLVFGTYSDSNNSSPAPPLSAGGSHHHLPQNHIDGGRGQGPQYANGGHIHTFSNGFNPMGPLGPAGYYPRQDGFIHHHPVTDNFARRHVTLFGHVEGYSPSGTPTGGENHRFPYYDPSTPHSLHGSQSSAPNEHELQGPPFHPQYSTAVISNGSNGHVEDVRLYHHQRSKARIVPQPLGMGQNNPTQPNMPQPHMLPGMDNLDGLIGYLQSQFAEPQYADYTLELRYSDDRATPVRIPGHNLLFARSPTLKNLMITQLASNGDGLTPRTLFIETDDRFLRSDGFWMAVQRLYGGPLLDPGAPAAAIVPTAAQFSSAMPGTPADRFEVALGYAAAGHILKMPPVVNRGIEIASIFVSWVTLEKALDFALDGGLDSQWTLDNTRYNTTASTYGPAVNILIHSALNFIITTFPPNFELDIAVSDPTHNRRLPLVLESHPTAPNPRLSSIKFGDHPSEDTVRSSPNNTTFPILSKILLNLPFPLLKYVLESSRLGNVHGWVTAALRQKVMHAVIEEREKRRINARKSRIISNAERRANSKLWDAVGWEESLAPPYGANETPTLTRKWVDFAASEKN